MTHRYVGGTAVDVSEMAQQAVGEALAVLLGAHGPRLFADSNDLKNALRSGQPSPRYEHLPHDKREFRVLAIRKEVRTLAEKAKEQLRHGSVWYG